ncbi:hypothetical protein [Cupriavidus lacunae]|uniref:Uncharacterized protein n=1 Tax=Cupriavidus lacunae TaxID=2666307 RepID=A0A370NQ80_9BURK|nr:hypothetical protein [Cupriavidus lacunae]RDK07770.1 hypothetical protein DN412_24150 [Cupriavidus lacunae]
MSSVPKIHTRFKTFDKEMRDIWESYNLVELLAKEGHRLLKDGTIEPLTMATLYGGNNKTLSLKDTFGAIDHLRRKSEPRTILLEAVAYFEDYLGWLTETVLLDDPSLLKSDAPNSEKEEAKLINLIVGSSDREEIIERIVEEKVRGIFYGNPVDFFIKPKTKLRFQKYFETKCQTQLAQYAEITARRNVIAHNNGRVDRKYMREVANPIFKLNQTVSLSDSYLRESIGLLLCLAARATELVLIGHYSATANGKLRERLDGCKCLPAI